MSDPDRRRGSDLSAVALEAGTRLVLVRHGEARCNVEEVVGGLKGCTGLTDKGVGQIEALARRLEESGELGVIEGFYTSVLARAKESAAVLARVIGRPAISDAALCERLPGEADGLTWAECEARYGGPNYPGDRPDLPLSPGGETWIEFLDRAAAALVTLALRHLGQSVVIVAHGGVIDASLIRFLALPDHGTAVRLLPDHASLTEWEHTGRRWRLVRYNDAAHLQKRSDASLRSEHPGWVHLEARR